MPDSVPAIYDSTPLRQYLQRLLEETGESYRRASLKAGLHQGSVSNYMGGVRPSRDACLALADHFGVDPNDMLQVAGYEPMQIFGRMLPELDEMGIGIRELAARFGKEVHPDDQRGILNRWHVDLDTYIESHWTPPRQILHYETSKSSSIQYIGMVDIDGKWEGEQYLLAPRARVVDLEALCEGDGQDIDADGLGDIAGKEFSLPSLKFSLMSQFRSHLADSPDDEGPVRAALKRIFQYEARDTSQLGMLARYHIGVSDAPSAYREHVHAFFRQSAEASPLLDTLRWLVFQEYDSPRSVWELGACPVCGHPDVLLCREEMTEDYTFACEYCQGEIYLTDVLAIGRGADEKMALAVAIDEFRAMRQLLLVRLLWHLMENEPDLLTSTLFVQQGPLDFLEWFGSMRQPMEALVQSLSENHGFYFAGFEPEEALVEFAKETAGRVENGSVLILDQKYMASHVELRGPGSGLVDRVVFKTQSGRVYTFALPVVSVDAFSGGVAFGNLPATLMTVQDCAERAKSIFFGDV